MGIDDRKACDLKTYDLNQLVGVASSPFRRPRNETLLGMASTVLQYVADHIAGDSHITLP